MALLDTCCVYGTLLPFIWKEHTLYKDVTRHYVGFSEGFFLFLESSSMGNKA